MRLLLILLPLVLCLLACGEPGAFSEAQALERQLLSSNPSANYADPAYLRVAKKLAEVPRHSSDYEQAQTRLREIQDARRLQLSKDLKLAYKPDRLAGKSPEDYRTKAEGIVPVSGRRVGGEEVKGLQATPGASAGEAPLARVAADTQSPVIMYSTSWCGYCRKARKYFQKNGVPFIDKDIEKDKMAAREVRKKVGSYSGVPVIDIDGKIIRGYNLPAIKKALAYRDDDGAGSQQ